MKSLGRRIDRAAAVYDPTAPKRRVRSPAKMSMLERMRRNKARRKDAGKKAGPKPVLSAEDKFAIKRYKNCRRKAINI